MPLHLAHHKSYHPYNRTNIQRVERDEAIAALQQSQLHSSSFTAQDQARLDLLRSQAATSRHASSHSRDSRLKAAEREVLLGKRGELQRHDAKHQPQQRHPHHQTAPAAANDRLLDATGHINFFAAQQQQQQQHLTTLRQRGTSSGQRQNPELIKEQHEARQRLEESIGASLGRPESELRPWYTNPDLQNGEERKKSDEQKLEAAYKESARKNSSDPLKAMEGFLSKRKQALEKQKQEQQQQSHHLPCAGNLDQEYSDLYNRDAVRAAKSRGRNRVAGDHDHDRVRHRSSAGGNSSRDDGKRRTSHSRRDEAKFGDTRPGHGRRERRRTARSKSRSPSPSRESSSRRHGSPRRENGKHRERRPERSHEPVMPETSGCPATQHEAIDLCSSSANEHEADQSRQSGSSGGSSSGNDAGPPTPTTVGENPYRSGSRSSMYPELFQEMVCTVLASESYLFSNAEVDLLSSFFMMSYAARYLFVRLLQRKRDTWYRLDRLTAYEQEIGDLRPAKEELARCLADSANQGAGQGLKIEHARREEELRRFKAMEDDKENMKLTLPELQRSLHLDEETGLCAGGGGGTQPAKQPSHGPSKAPLTLASSSSNLSSPHTGKVATMPQAGSSEKGPSPQRQLSRFVLTEVDMQGGAVESMSLLTLEELKVLAKKLNIVKTGTTRAQHIAALLATKNQATLFGGPSPKKKPDPSTGSRQLTLNFGSSGKKTAQTSCLREELDMVLQGGCIQVASEVRSLVDRVALVYYRGNLLGSAALTAAVLSRSRRRSYPIYGFKRCSFLFPSRDHLIAFERALEIEARMEHLIQFGRTEQDHREALELFESVYQEWQDCVAECSAAHPEGVDKMVYHRMRFHPGWILSRVVYKGATCLARFKLHDREKEVLTRLLDQRVFRRGRRGDWYDRLALITALYSGDAKKGKKEALQISIRGIQDPDTHLIYHDTLQRRVGRLQSQLRVPRSEQHDFSYAKLKRTTEVVFEGLRLDAMLDQEAASRNSPGARMNSFLQRRSSSLSPSKAAGLTRSASEKSLTGGRSPLKRQQDHDGVGTASPSATTSGFQVRKSLYKRVKIEKFAAAVTAEEEKRALSESVHSVVKKEEVGDDATDVSPTFPSAADTRQEPSSPASASRPPAVKREDSNDSIANDLALDGIDPCALQEDPTLFSLGLNSADTPVEVRKETRTSMRSVWRGLDGQPCHVEQLCLQHYARQGFKGSHCEGKILTMIFALVMWDVLFRSDVEGSFETPFQAAPLDLGSDAFAIVRSREIRARLDEIEETGGLHLLAAADDEQRPRRTWAVGCRWDMFSKEDLLEVAECLGGRSIAVVCQMFCEEWEHCTGGMPDLVIWRMRDRCVRFVEVKGPGDRLSETQKVWIDVLLRAGVDVQVGLVVEARGG